VASAAVFAYKSYTERQLSASIESLNQAINDFSVSNLQMIVEFDSRLKGAVSLLDSHVSLATALTILEQGTVKSVAFADLNFTRVDPDTLEVTAALTAENFDSAIFQRELYIQNELLASTTLTDLVFTPKQDAKGERTELPEIAVSGTFMFAAGTIAYTPNASSSPVQSATSSSPTAAGDAATPESSLLVSVPALEAATLGAVSNEPSI